MTSGKYDQAALSTCTTCTYSEDFSNYWTASLYFKSPDNGTFQRVPQMANAGIQQDGGMTVYYMLYSAKNNKVTAFSPGFRMLAGDPTLRNRTDSFANICHRCLAASDRLMGGDGAPCDANDFKSFPPKMCAGGIRATVIFPSCWDGKNLDSPDHQSHVAYSEGGWGGATGGGSCPSTHPVKLPQVMYELMWNVTEVRRVSAGMCV